MDEIMKMMQRKRREKGLLGPSRATLQGQATICEIVARIEEATLPIFGSISLFLASQSQATMCETVARIEGAKLPIFDSINHFLAT